MINMDYAALSEEAIMRLFAPTEPETARYIIGETPVDDPAAMSDLRDGGIPPLLWRAMRYSVAAGGKRLRPSMLFAAADMLGVDRGRAEPFAVALEMIHTYSLIHDDLPGMDNDTLRRGRPTNHVVFGEGQAILAGDGLLNQAAEMMNDAALSETTFEGMRQSLLAGQEILKGAGVCGMIGGQCADLYAERKRLSDEKTLQYIDINKTSHMLTSPLRAAARLSGCLDDCPDLQALTDFGRSFGLLFQAVDDILDVEGDAAVLGKSTGKDAESGKLTYVTLYGLDGAKARASRLEAEARASLERFGARAAWFNELLDGMLTRKK